MYTGQVWASMICCSNILLSGPNMFLETGRPCWVELYKRSLQPAEKKEIKAILTQNIFLQAMVLIIKKISPAKFKVKGPAKFLTISKNHQNLKEGEIVNIPLFKVRLRECLRSQAIFAQANMPEEQRPCATIITMAPFNPH